MTLEKLNISSTDHSAVSSQETPHKLELVDEFGEKNGIALMVVGSEAHEISEYSKKVIGDREFRREMAKAKGKQPYIVPLSESIDFSLTLTAMKVKEWNYSDECTLENVKAWLEKNPQYMEQVIEYTNARTNFTKG